MTKQTINVGTSPNDNRGDSLRASFQKINANFTELYTALGINADVNLNLGAFEFTGSVMTTTDSSAIVIDQAVTVSSNLTVGGDVLPSVSNGGDLGSSARPWRSLYVSNNTIYIGGTTLSVNSNGNLLINGNLISTSGASSPVRIAIGLNAGETSQGDVAVAIGLNAGQTSQGEGAIAVGDSAGQTTQGIAATAIGAGAGGTTQGAAATAVGNGAGQVTQGIAATAIGAGAGSNLQSTLAVAVGAAAGETSQGVGAVAVGANAGYVGQSTNTVAVGASAGETNQGIAATAVGSNAGNEDQGVDAVAVGGGAGQVTQGEGAVAVGASAGATNQGGGTVAVGVGAGNLNQGDGAVAVGINAGSSGQGVRAIAIGQGAGEINQAANSIIINASTDAALNQTIPGTFTVAPIRNIGGTSGVLQYNAATKEVSYSSDITSEGNINIEINLSDSTKRIWQFGEDGDLTLPSTSGFIDRLYTDNGGSRTKLEKKIESSPTAGTIAKLELDLDNGHIRLAIGNYTGGNDQWIDTSTWAFRGDTGSLTLPPAGKIINNNNEWTFGTTGTLTTPGQVNAKTRIKIETTDVAARYEAYLDTIEILTNTLAASGYVGAGLPARKESYEILVRAKASNPLIPDAAITQANNLRNLYYAWANATAELEVGDGFVIRDGDATNWRFEQLTGLRFPNNTFQTTAWTGSVSSLVRDTHTASLGTDGTLTIPGDIKSNSNINIDINLSDSTLRRWQFGEDGNLTLPNGRAYIGVEGDGGVSIFEGEYNFDDIPKTSIKIGGTNDNYAFAVYSEADTAKSWRFVHDGTTQLPGSLTLNGSLTGVNDIRSEGNINIDINLADSTLRRWQFGEDGALTFPNGTNQTTAWTGSLTNTAYGVPVSVSLDTSANLLLPFDGYAAFFASKTIFGNNTGGAVLSSGQQKANVVTRTDGSIQLVTNGDGYAFAGLSWTFGTDGNLTLPGSIIGTATQNVFNTTSTTVNAFGAATTLNIGVAGGTTTIAGDLTVSGTTTTINSTTLTVDDKNIELGSVASPTNTTADGGGITLKGATDKTFNWVNATSAWTSSEDLNLLTGKVYEINGVAVLSATALLNDASQTSVTIAGSATTALNIGASGAPITGFAKTATTASTASSLGYLGLPQSATATTATLAIGDAGKHIYVTTAGQTITIPANGTVAYPIGTTITFIAGASATTVLIAITTDTMRLSGGALTGTRTLAANGMATAVKVAATTWYINGTGLT